MPRTISLTKLGFENGASQAPDPDEILPVIRLKMLATGLEIPTPHQEQIHDPAPDFTAHTADLIRKIQEKYRSYPQPFCPLDSRIQSFLEKHFTEVSLPGKLEIPLNTLHMDFHGLARTLSIPAHGDKFESEFVKSYRTTQGVLHNPATDRRTTKGTFHVGEGGLPIPADKISVPKAAFARLLWHAFHPPASLLELPFTSGTKKPARVFTTLFIRPMVSPEIPGIRSYRDMEVRFFAPASLVSNLDFVESIFGNAGDPYLPENDAGLDPEHFSGITGCVILAPHLQKLKKKDLGLPHTSEATAANKRDGMCWTEPDELYNGGKAFKATFRSTDGVIVTLITDNYFGYCKKEVKTMMSFACNLTGGTEEEHAGGALIFPSYSLGDFTQHNATYIRQRGHSFSQVKKLLGDSIQVHADGYGIDKTYSQTIYLPEDAEIFLLNQKIVWKKDGKDRSLRLLPDHHYIYPSGYKVHMEKHPDAATWRLIGTVAEGLVFHKPCTVSGGGKSEISKSISDSILYRAFYIQDFKKDFDAAEKVLDKDFSTRFRLPTKSKPKASREILSPARSLGSVVRLLTPSAEYSDEYNRWLKNLPPHVRSLVFTIKRFYRAEWGDDIQSHFSVDVVDGRPGHELSYNHKKLVSSYLKVGMDENDNWRVFRLRTDYVPAKKLQIEDDITVSTVLPVEEDLLIENEIEAIALEENKTAAASSAKTKVKAKEKPYSQKFVQNCEYRLFQRPDDAVHPGLDRQAEKDLSSPNTFMSNYEPMTTDKVRDLMDDAIMVSRFTPPMRQAIENASKQDSGYFVCSAKPRMIDGKPSANVRYLQNRPDLVDPYSVHLAQMGIRLRRKLTATEPVLNPVNVVLIGRRNNPPDVEAGIRPLAVYNPLHFQELPEAFMDFISSPTGKSPSTTGAGSEGALTKGPFNALWPTADLNAALVSFILTGLKVFSTPAGHIGGNYRVDHDMSLLLPEVWSRMTATERDAEKLIRGGFLSRVNDFTYKGRNIPAGRLGYRINTKFVHAYLGRIFSDPLAVFPEDMLEPELQGQNHFVDGIENIADTQKASALFYFEDRSVDSACPPLQALLNIMAYGNWEGKTLKSPEVRKMFTRESLLKSDWYQKRLERQQEKDKILWQRHDHYLKEFLQQPSNKTTSNRLGLAKRLKFVEKKLREAKSSGYLKSLAGTIGVDPAL